MCPKLICGCLETTTNNRRPACTSSLWLFPDPSPFDEREGPARDVFLESANSMGSAPLIQLTHSPACDEEEQVYIRRGSDDDEDDRGGGGAAVVARESIVNLLSRRPRPAVRPPGRARARPVSTFTKLSPRARPATARTRARPRTCYQPVWRGAGCAALADDKLAFMIRIRSSKFVRCKSAAI